MSRTELNADADGAWEAIGPLLEEAMRQLKPAQQDALVLRYFEGKSLREARRSLAITEDAMQKRVGRALDKLRSHFARKGMAVSTAAIAELLKSLSSSALEHDRGLVGEVVSQWAKSDLGEASKRMVERPVESV